MTFDEWFGKVQNAKSSGLLFLFNRLLREFGLFGTNVEDFSGDIAFCISESLRLPDLCGKVIWSKDTPTDRAINWLNEFVVPYGLGFSANSIVELRNAYVHEAFVDKEYAFCNPLFSQYANLEKMQIQYNLLNACMQISRTAVGFYLEHYSDFDAFGKDYSANRCIYDKEAGLEKVREFAYVFFGKNPDICR